MIIDIQESSVKGDVEEHLTVARDITGEAYAGTAYFLSPRPKLKDDRV